MAMAADGDGELGFDYLFQIQIAGERIQIPAKAIFTIEHEREGNMEEIEF